MLLEDDSQIADNNLNCQADKLICCKFQRFLKREMYYCINFIC